MLVLKILRNCLLDCRKNVILEKCFCVFSDPLCEKIRERMTKVEASDVGKHPNLIKSKKCYGKRLTQMEFHNTRLFFQRPKVR